MILSNGKTLRNSGKVSITLKTKYEKRNQSYKAELSKERDMMYTHPKPKLGVMILPLVSLMGTRSLTNIPMDDP